MSEHRFPTPDDLAAIAKLGLSWECALRQAEETLASESTVLAGLVKVHTVSGLPEDGALIIPQSPPEERDPLGWMAEHAVKIRWSA